MYIWIAIIIFTFIFIYLNINKLQETKYAISSEKLPGEFNGFTIVHLSDLHLKKIGKNNSKLLSLINKNNPNIILMTGDMINKYNNNYDELIDLIKRLNNKYPIYYSLGNHELALEHDEFVSLIGTLKSLKVNILTDEKVKFYLKDESINIYGIDFKKVMEQEKPETIDFKKYNIERYLGAIEKDCFNLLLAHDPLNFKIYDKWGPDLIFSGHVHGGIIRIFNRGLLSPRNLFYPKYSAGVYGGKNSKMIVSRGIGNGFLKFRLFNLPEIVVVKLKINN